MLKSNQLLHLGRHVAVECWRAEDHSVCLPEIVERADRNTDLSPVEILFLINFHIRMFIGP